MHRLQNLVDIRHCCFYCLRSFGSVGFIFRKIFGADIGFADIKNHSQMRRIFSFYQFNKRVCKTKYRRGIQPFAGQPWVFNKGIISSENHRISIYQIEPFVFVRSHGTKIKQIENIRSLFRNFGFRLKFLKL